MAKLTESEIDELKKADAELAKLNERLEPLLDKRNQLTKAIDALVTKAWQSSVSDLSLRPIRNSCFCSASIRSSVSDLSLRPIRNSVDWDMTKPDSVSDLSLRPIRNL